LAPHLPPPLLVEALQVARAIDYEPIRCRALAALVPHLSTGEREVALAEALHDARATWGEMDRLQALAAVATHMPADERAVMLAEALHVARDIEDEVERSQALAGLAPHLPPPLLAETLQVARAIDSAWYRSEALAALAPQLARLPRPALTALWTENLPILASRTRLHLLADLSVMTPVLIALAGPNASVEFQEIATAIRDVGRWWP
jgi:hypothetical protein